MIGVICVYAKFEKYCLCSYFCWITRLFLVCILVTCILTLWPGCHHSLGLYNPEVDASIIGAMDKGRGLRAREMLSAIVHNLLGCVFVGVCGVWECVHARALLVCVTTCTFYLLCFWMCLYLHLIAGDLICPDTEIMFAFSFSQPCWSVTKLALTDPVHQAGMPPPSPPSHWHTYTPTHPRRPHSLSDAASLRPRC